MADEVQETATDTAPAAPAADAALVDAPATESAPEMAGTDAKPEDGDKPTEVEASSDDDAPKEGNTDEQAEALKIAAPEGMEAYQDDFDQFTGAMDEFMKANPKAEVKDVLKQAAEWQAARVTKMQEDAAAAFEQQINEWADEARNDAVIGGEKFDENLATAKRGLDAVADEKVKELLQETGLGSHPAVITAFFKVGSMVADSKIVGDSVATSAPDASRRARYPSSRPA